MTAATLDRFHAASMADIDLAWLAYALVTRQLQSRSALLLLIGAASRDHPQRVVVVRHDTRKNAQR